MKRLLWLAFLAFLLWVAYRVVTAPTAYEAWRDSGGPQREALQRAQERNESAAASEATGKDCSYRYDDSGNKALVCD